MKHLSLIAACAAVLAAPSMADTHAAASQTQLVDLSEVRESVQCDGRRFAILPLSNETPEPADVFAIVESSEILSADTALLVSRDVAERMASEQCIFAGALEGSDGLT